MMENTPSDPATYSEPASFAEPAATPIAPPSSDPPSRWQENHGNFLMAFLAGILVLGGGLLAYRQSRFVPPSFPTGEFIDTVSPSGEADEATDTVLIEVSGAVSEDGQMAIAIFDGQSSFNEPGEAVLTYSAPIIEGVATWKVARSQLPTRFAIAAYHDENIDAELNRNRFGIPTERYGFSRNARGMTGPPSFQQAVIDRPEAGSTISILIR